jgi:broad specificity phosphatase PhoE
MKALSTHGDGSNMPRTYLARHGETAWSLTGQHTGRTDLTLTERGMENACALGQKVAQIIEWL